MSMRLFEVSIRLKISAEEATAIKTYLTGQGKTGEIGHLIRDYSQEMLDDLARRSIMYVEKGGGE